MPYVQTMKTKVWRDGGAGHVVVARLAPRSSASGPARDEAGLEMLKAAGRQQIAAEQTGLDLRAQVG